MRKFVYLLFIGLAMHLCADAQSQPTADQIIQEACKTAAYQHKNVFIIFHASWCSWCHRMDSLMNNKECQPLFSHNYVIRHIDVLESANKKNLENQGGEKLLKKYHGEDQGIPYWLILSENGKLLADSRVKPENANPDGKYNNAGCPAEPQEVDYFIRVLKETSSLQKDQLAVIKNNFQKN